MNKQESFESERLLYRGINELDTECLVRWRSEPELIRFFRNPEPITLRSHLEWFSNSYMKNDFRFDFIIFEKSSERCIGTVGVSAIDLSAGACEISYMIAEFDFRRKGFAQEAVSAMMGKMIRENIRTFFAEIHKDNLASINMVRKLGFSFSSQCGDFIMFAIEKQSGVQFA